MTLNRLGRKRLWWEWAGTAMIVIAALFLLVEVSAYYLGHPAFNFHDEMVNIALMSALGVGVLWTGPYLD